MAALPLRSERPGSFEREAANERETHGLYSIGQKYLITSWVLCHFRPSGPIVLKFELEIPDGIIFKF